MLNNNTNRSVNDLDDLDLLLIAELEIDAHQTISELARKLDAERHTVDRKLQKLLEDKIIKIMATPDPLAMGYRTQAWIGINTLPSEVNAVAEEVGKLEAVRHIHINAGRYDVHVWTVFQRPEDLSSFVTEELARIKGITNAETMVNLKMTKGFFGLLAKDPYSFRDKPPERLPDALDRRLIRELWKDPLQNRTQLAAKLGTSPTTLWRRLQRLLTERIIRIVAVPDPLVFGYTTRATVAVNASPERIDAVAEAMGAFVNLHGITINTGRFDILAWGDFKGSADLSDFVTNQLGQIPGVLKHETMVTLRVTKDDFSYDA